MRALLLFCLAVPLVLGADKPGARREPANKKRADRGAVAQKREAPAPAPAAPVVIPKDAVEVGPNLWKWTDPQGKGVFFRKTPFGVSRYDESAVEAANAAFKLPEGMKAVDAGDEVRFERPTPFGVSTWKKKKADMDDVERLVWERDRDKGSGEKPSEEKK